MQHSEWSIRQMTGSCRNTSNWRMVKEVQDRLKTVTTSVAEGGSGKEVEIMHVNSHVNIRWNEWADKFARASAPLGIRVRLAEVIQNFKAEFPNIGDHL